jgi:hypothetical protein
MKTTGRFLVAAMSAALIVQPVLAQQPQHKKDERPATPNEITIAPLKHSAASEVAQVIGQLFGDQQRGGTTVVTADLHTNSVIVSAPPSRIAEIREVIVKIDTPAARKEAPGKPLRVFTLRNTSPDKSLEEAVRLAIGAGVRIDGKVAFDRTRNQVIVSADETTLNTIEALIAKLDVAAAVKPVEEVQLRVVWLVKGAAASEFSAPSEDLKDVLPALAKLGIDKPRLAAQTVVNVSPNTGFTSEGIVNLNEQIRFTVSGQAQERGDNTPILTLNIRAVGPNNNLYSGVSTEISAPIGHFVVLGVTPTQSLTSVFVVQVLKR